MCSFESQFGLAWKWLVGAWQSCSWINQKRFQKVREKLDFLVVQDMYHSTESAQIADLVLLAAGWGEKEGSLLTQSAALVAHAK